MQEEKVITGRLDIAEKHIGGICTTVGEYIQKVAKLRNAGDSLAQSLSDYGKEETLNKSLKESLTGIASTLAVVQDYRNVQVELLENLVLPPLLSYRAICKNSKEQIRSCFEERKKELNHEKNIERTKNKANHNKQHILQADARLKKVQKELKKSSLKIDEQVDNFECKKLEDLKSILTNVMQTELAFHVKAVELYSHAFNQAASIDCELDLESLRNVLKGVSSSDEVVARNEEDFSPPPAKATLSTVDLFGTAEAKRKQSASLDKNESSDNLKVQDYEEIGLGSSDDE